MSRSPVERFEMVSKLELVGLYERSFYNGMLGAKKVSSDCALLDIRAR
jgi:hypothetical protein